MENVDAAVYFPFSIFNLGTTTVVIDSLKLTFPCDATVFVGDSLTASNGIFFGRKDDRGYSVCSLAFYKTAGYCLDECFAICENIVWISFKKMCGKLLPPPGLYPYTKCSCKTMRKISMISLFFWVGVGEGFQDKTSS